MRESERGRDHAVVACLAVHLEALLEHPTRRLEVALVERQVAIWVCAFARAAGEPEPSASRSSIRSRPSATWPRICQ